MKESESMLQESVKFISSENYTEDFKMMSNVKFKFDLESITDYRCIYGRKELEKELGKLILKQLEGE